MLCCYDTDTASPGRTASVDCGCSSGTCMIGDKMIVVIVILLCEQACVSHSQRCDGLIYAERWKIVA